MDKLIGQRFDTVKCTFTPSYSAGCPYNLKVLLPSDLVLTTRRSLQLEGNITFWFFH